MRVAIVSDLHANLEALRTIADVLGDADRVICLGDMIGYYCQVNEVLSVIRDLGALCIQGNHDRFLFEGCPPSSPPAVVFGVEVASRLITPAHRAWLAELPLVWGGVVGGRSVLLTHGSPWRPETDYLYADSPKLTDLDAFDFDLVALGQTHCPMVRASGRPWIVNPGAVGQSRHRPAVASAVVWDTEAMVLEPVERPYDPEPVIALARAHGAGAWVTKHLTEGP